MASPQYRYMRRRITALRGSLLPRTFSPTGLYSDRVHERAAAFRLLAHAEFEAYLEDRVTTHAVQQRDRWLTTGRASTTIAALVAYDTREQKPADSILAPVPKPAPLLQDRIKDAVNQFNVYVRTMNHGVREKNVLNMCLPLGVDPARLDLTWLANLDSWAQERGEFAHKSSAKIQSKVDPAREYTTVRSLADGFRDVDLEISRLTR